MCDPLRRGKEEIWVEEGGLAVGRFRVWIRSRGRLVFHAIDASQRHNFARISVKLFSPLIVSVVSSHFVICVIVRCQQS